MAKKRKKKNKKLKRRFKYSKHEFMDICCRQCQICADGVDPAFCYPKVYKQDPKKFMLEIFGLLLVIHDEILNGTHQSGKTPEKEAAEIFNRVFAKIDFSNRKKARRDFYCQMLDQTPLKAQGKKKKKKQRYVVQPYPTFFCNPEFMEEVKATINDGNDDQQQNPVEEPTGGVKADSDAASASTEPKVR